jgi:very-short-patch-repair endonuclease
MQLKNKAKDELKKEIAKKYGFKLFYIWENEIKNGDFSVLDKIKEVYNEF